MLFFFLKTFKPYWKYLHDTSLYLCKKKNPKNPKNKNQDYYLYL